MNNNLYICCKFTKMSGVNGHISQLREDFMKGQLSENATTTLPDLQFEKWMQEAVEAKVNEVQAFNLATVNASNKPSSRIVYLREFAENEFYFYLLVFFITLAFTWLTTSKSREWFLRTSPRVTRKKSSLMISPLRSHSRK